MSQHYTRHHALDLIRGIAILGILVVNIWAFAMPFAAYSNPTVYGEFNALHQLIWQISYVVVQEKFITMFSILFGAGVMLFVEHSRARNDRVAYRHYRRMFAMWIIGMIHGYAIWSGDVLVMYATMGFILYLFLARTQRTILIVTSFLLVMSILLFLSLGASIAQMDEAAKAEALKHWQPTAEALQNEITAMRGSWLEQLPQRAAQTFELQTMMLFLFSIRLLAQMLLGVWLYRSGWLTGEKSTAHYRAVALIALPLGLAMSYWASTEHLAAQFDITTVMGNGGLANNIGSLIAAIGYMALFIVWTKSNVFSRLRLWLQNTGRMAFTSYLGTSIVCTFIFNGHGLGLFGQLDRTQQVGIVLSVWIAIVSFAQWWLARHQQGPLEQLWRFATYGRRSE